MKGDIVTTYKVLSDNMANHSQGSIIADDDLVGINIDALIAGGHIERTQTVAPKKVTDKE